jgi:hypothetical protein
MLSKIRFSQKLNTNFKTHHSKIQNLNIHLAQKQKSLKKYDDALM